MAIKVGPNSKNGRTNPLVMYPEIKAGGTNSILASLFRTILHDRKLSEGTWNYLMDSYIKNPVNALKQTQTDLSSARGNLSKQIGEEKMTWRTFCKCLRFMQVVRFELTIKAFWTDKTHSIHTKSINLGIMTDDDEE